VNRVIDLTHYEEHGKALEGTGSMVFDRVNKVAFAVESPRADRDVFMDFCRQIGYEPAMFHAFDEQGKPIYHTNVVLSIGTDFALVAPQMIPKEDDMRLDVLTKLRALRSHIIPVSPQQVADFGANILELRGSKGPIIILSQRALEVYSEDQIKALKLHGNLVPFDMPTIETIGGGSARCILAEVFKSK
jgi:hypothetical protein